MKLRNLRLNLAFSFIVLFSAVLLSKLFFVQVLDADFYKALAQGLGASLHDNEIQVERGEIFLKNGEPLAINKDWPLVFASSPKITEAEETAEILAGVFNLDKNFILEKLQKDTLYSPIKKKLAEEEVAAGATLVGPHRDDFGFKLKGKDLSAYGSRGEQRLSILWLKLCELEFITQAVGERPILLLDDIFSELDKKHRKLVLDIIPLQQTIITTAEQEMVEKDYLKKIEMVKLG